MISFSHRLQKRIETCTNRTAKNHAHFKRKHRDNAFAGQKSERIPLDRSKPYIIQQNAFKSVLSVKIKSRCISPFIPYVFTSFCFDAFETTFTKEQLVLVRWLHLNYTFECSIQLSNKFVWNWLETQSYEKTTIVVFAVTKRFSLTVSFCAQRLVKCVRKYQHWWWKAHFRQWIGRSQWRVDLLHEF